MLLALHGASILKILLILSFNFAIAKCCGGSRLGPILTWVFNGAVLFANERHSGYLFHSIHPSLGSLVSYKINLGKCPFMLWIQDGFRGVYPRWHISFNVTMLRLVSFSMDYYWARGNSPSCDVSIHAVSWSSQLCAHNANGSQIRLSTRNNVK
jgi:hypothetical protein